MISKNIEIVSSSIIKYSSMSNVSRQSIYKLLGKHYTNVRITLIDCKTDLEKLIKRKPDLVFLGMKFIPNNLILGLDCPDKIWLSEYLDANNIVYTGSVKNSHVIERYKNLAKLQIQNAGLKTSPYFLATKDSNILESKLITYPLFVKPNDRGGGLGIDDKSLIYNSKDLIAKIKENYTLYSADSLVEEYLPGREFTVSILKSTKSNRYSIMPIELIAPVNILGDRILSGKVKEADTERSKILDEGNLKDTISELAYKSFCAIGGRDYGRIDIRLDKNNVPNFLEANLFPSLVKDFGNFPKACKIFLGYSYDQTILHITNLALQRSNDAPLIKNMAKAYKHNSPEPALI